MRATGHGRVSSWGAVRRAWRYVALLLCACEPAHQEPIEDPTDGPPAGPPPCIDVGSICTVIESGGGQWPLPLEPTPVADGGFFGKTLDVAATDEAIYTVDGSHLSVIQGGWMQGLAATSESTPPTATSQYGGNQLQFLAAHDLEISRDTTRLLLSANYRGVATVDLASAVASWWPGLDDCFGEPLCLDDPSGVADDDAGHIFVLDEGQLVRVDESGTRTALVDAVGFADGSIETAAVSEDVQGLDYLDGALVFADLGNRAVRRYDLATGLLETIAGIPPGSSAVGIPTNQVEGPTPALGVAPYPYDVAFGPDGAVYVGEQACVLRIRDGLLERVAGVCWTVEPWSDADGPALEAVLGYPYGIDVSPDGTWLYIAEYYGIRAVKLQEGPDCPALAPAE